MTYAAFQESIFKISEKIGEPTLASVVANHAIRCLDAEVRLARNLQSWGQFDWGTWWTTVSEFEFGALA